MESNHLFQRYERREITVSLTSYADQIVVLATSVKFSYKYETEED